MKDDENLDPVMKIKGFDILSTMWDSHYDYDDKDNDEFDDKE